MSRKLLATLFVLLLMLLLAACGGGAEEETPAGGEVPVIGLVQIDRSHPFHLGEEAGAQEAARRHGFELRITSGEGDVNKQIEAFENLVNEGVDAIAVNFIDVEAFGPAMQKAKEAGIPVVCLHSETEGCATVLGFDEWATGRSVGDYSVQVLQEAACWPDCQAANLQGLLGQGLNEARSGGWKEQVEAGGVEVVAQEPTDWQPEKAVAAMENWLVAYPDLNLVYGNSDGLTVPAAETARAAGRDDLIFVSVDGSDFAMEAIQDGLLESTFLYAPEYSGYWKAWVPYRIAMGETVDPEILIKGVLINSDNVADALVLAKDQKEDMENFEFEKTLPQLIEDYMGMGAAPPEEEMKVIGLVQIDRSHPFHLGEEAGATEAARRHGFELRITSGEGDVNKQIEAFENLVNEGVDAIAVNFIDVDAFGPAMQKAQDAGIPVVCLHSETEGCAAVLGFDEWATGRSVGDYSVEVLKTHECWPDCEAANLQGLLGQGLNEARSGGWKENIEAGGVTVVSQEPTDWQPEKAVAAMENWLVAYPGLDLVYGNSDGLTVPAAETARAAGRDDIVFVSVDGSDFAMEAIQSGLLESTFLYAPEYSGYWKAWVPFRIAMGEDPGYEILIKGVLINGDNVDNALVLAKDQKEDMENFQFELSLPELIEIYMAQ
jgi:ABC-type sugar transport system substrate-binding protein